MRTIFPLLGLIRLICPIGRIAPIGPMIVASAAHSFAAGQTIEPQGPPSVPYAWKNVTIGGGGFVTGIVTHPAQKGLMYARTDVGGAYRWDVASGRWIAITDWIGFEDWQLTGIESLAVDPSDPARVYLAAGIYRWCENAAILRSADRGETWERTNVALKMGGNETGRFNGERLAVDPNDGRVLFFGSRYDGLWRSADRGATWNKVESFPGVEPAPTPPEGGGWYDPEQRVGTVFVHFDARSGEKGKPTPTIYAAVSTPETSLYRSADAGATWSAVPNQPTGLRPNHIAAASDGTLYISYGKEEGPNYMTDGAVWKCDPARDRWTDITPDRPTSDSRFGYGGVTVDASNPQVVMVTTFNRWTKRDDVFRSIDGGKTWKGLLREAQWDHSNAPWTAKAKPHWMGDIEIDPFDPGHVLFSTGYGIWACRNATQADSAKPTKWSFDDNGLEETVPLDLISPPKGAHLLSVLGDVDGFVHDDLDSAPAAQFASPPRFDNAHDIAFAAKKPKTVVRIGSFRKAKPDRAHGAYSRNGGRTWTPFASDPPDCGGGVAIEVSSDGKTIVWTVGQGNEAYFSRDNGTTWTRCAGFGIHEMIVADCVDPDRFCFFDARNAKIYVSNDGAASFSAVDSAVSETSKSAPGFGGGGEDKVRLYSTPGREGHLWIADVGGLYRSTDSGKTISRIGSVNEAYYLGFGRPAKKRAYPALYLVGGVAGALGAFRSDDEGATWARIDDERHRFGQINCIVGDPRVYGRVYIATGGRGIIYGDPAKPARASRP